MNTPGTYVIGMDFGTLSARALLVETASGHIVGHTVSDYQHGVMDTELPDGSVLGPDWALQDPGDYLQALQLTIRRLMEETGVDPDLVVGIALACTASTVLPTTGDGTPLCFLEEFRSHPHAYAKLWKHHAAEPQAERLNHMAVDRDEAFVRRYGGKTSCEWLFPKLMQLYEEAPHLYARTKGFWEAGDWITMMLSGNARRSSCAAGYKGLWHPEAGYPSPAFFASLYPAWEHVVEQKLGGDIQKIGGQAGTLTPQMAQRTGLNPGIAVGVATIDAHAAMPAMGITEPGHLLMIMGTSTCHLLLHHQEVLLRGIAGVVKDGMIPGYWGYEAGQAAVGDLFQWLVDHFTPLSYWNQAHSRGISMYDLLGEKAACLQVGESGLLALDWWNGNRSVLMDAQLSGLILGLNLQTRAEDIYRSLIEATAFGTQMIIDNFAEHHMPIHTVSACGGIAEKSDVLLQIYADVTGRTLHATSSVHTVAFGAAVWAAVAAGSGRGGYDTVHEAVRYMVKPDTTAVRPSMEHHRLYQELYGEYLRLHDYLGRGSNQVMKTLKRLAQSHKKGERAR